MRSKFTVTGVVQGVGFRPFVYRIAVENNLKGYVKNVGDGTVEIEVEGSEADIEKFVFELFSKKPPLAKIETVKRIDFKDDLGYKSFMVLKSDFEEKESASLIPPDIGICDECARELFDSTNRRYRYHFITCTNCGPRFTIIERFPYDRNNTSMIDFPMCNLCAEEYSNPLDRRFNAETIACPDCGPKIMLLDRYGSIVKGDPITLSARFLDEGKILAIKGIGGFHIALSAYDDNSILKLRKWKGREQKPFAVMAKDIETVKKFAYVDELEEKILSSPFKPIVLLSMKENCNISRYVSPGLHNIGVMLPYTGVHLLIFSESKTDVLIMTSGNLPSEPITVDENDAVKNFSSIVDYYLVHDRKILHRCDDSVVRKVDGTLCFLRRSRGFVPEPLYVKDVVDAVGVGGEENVAGCVASSNKIYLTQYVGDVENIETLEYLKSALKRMVKLTACKPKAIAHDLHPTFNTTIYAKELSSQLGVPNIPVQHHHAHIVSVMAEHGLDRTIGIAVDGFGYGSDGNAWGGEILFCEKDHFERVGHLEEHPYLGGDLAAKYPARMIFSILYKTGLIDSWLKSNIQKFPWGFKEIELLKSQLESGNHILTSSFGRVLDAISTLLNVCDVRTYEGEPAIKLESFARKAVGHFTIKPIIDGDVLLTAPLLKAVLENLEAVPAVELAYAAEEYLAKGVAEIAVEKAREYGVDNVSLSGGVAYNEHISKTIRKVVESNNIKLFRNMYAPAGDGCVSLGQAYLVGKWMLN
ncbi:MAG: carbamoyltransferase HypF [Nitrososphaeria archaeon]